MRDVDMRANLAAVIVLSAIFMLSGCATGAKGSARRACYDSGLQPGTLEFSNCWHGIARRDNGAALNSVVGAAIGYGIMQSGPAPMPSAIGARHLLTRESFAYTGDRMCQYDNGTVLNVGNRTCMGYIEGR